MDPSTWERLEAVFFTALELEEEERAEYLDRACAGDADLRAEVEAVLASHRAVGADEPLQTGAGSEPSSEGLVGARVGAWRLEGRVGRGGMGEVYRARRADEEYDQEAAVKIVRTGLSSWEMVRRFRLERQILARLEHPNISTLLDGGVTPEGHPYLVMQFVRGVPITEYADVHRLSVRERLGLFVTVCRTVQFAHSSLVVHRDLKPSNILVTDDGRVRLLDFGIAKLLDPEDPGGVTPTESLLLLTPEHAAPEQFLGLPITTATDVYQLGVLLYELLAGERPFRGRASLDLHRAICEEEPTRPSAWPRAPACDGDAAADTVAAADRARARVTTPEGLRRQLRGDLDRIVLKALRKEPDRRYASAADLADDVERHLQGYPVRARPERFGYVAGRFVRRHRVAVATGVALAASLIALLFSSVRFAATTSAQAEALADERDVAIEVSSFLESLFEASDPYASGSERRDTLRVGYLLEEGTRRVRESLAEGSLVRARLLATLGTAWRNLGGLEEAQPLLEEALDIRRAELGSEAVEVAASRLDLAQLLADRGAHAEAEAQLDSSLAVFGRDSVVHARPLSSAVGILGGVLQATGRFEEAESAYRRALALSAKDSTIDDGRRAEHLSNLATALVQQAELEEAERLLSRAVELSRKHLGDEHPTTAGMLNNYGNVLRERHRLDEAEGVFREALAIRRARFPRLHPAVAVSVNNLADALLAQDDLSGAEPLFRESLEMRRAIYGERHPAVGIGWVNLAAVLQRDDGRRAEAAGAYEEARAILVGTLGPDHPLLGAVDGNLGRLHHDDGDHSRALGHLRTALDVRLESYDETHPLVLGNLSDIARCLTDLGRYGEAEPLLLAALRGLEARDDEQPQLRDGVLVRLSRLYEAMGRESEAERYEAMRARTGS